MNNINIKNNENVENTISDVKAKVTSHDFLWVAGLSLAGFIFILNYIFKASMDVPTSDYIRIINSYIDNVFDIKKFFVPDLVARVPVTYLFRIINVTFFKYSIHFDRVVGLIFLSIFNFLIVKRVRTKLQNVLLKNLTSIALTINIFSLMSWEMLLNGSGYTIFIFFDLVLIIYDIYEKNVDCESCIMCQHKRSTCKRDLILFMFLILATCFFTGSDYQVALICTIIFFSIIIFIVNLFNMHSNADANLTKNINNCSGHVESCSGRIVCEKCHCVTFLDEPRSSSSRMLESVSSKTTKNLRHKILYILHNKQFILILTSALAFVIYYIGNHAGEVANYTYVGMSNRSIFDIIIHDFPYCLSYVIKSLASIIIGVETFEYALTLGNIQEIHILLVGIAFLIIILLVIFLIFYYKIYKKDLFSVMIFFHGLLSILFVFIARAPFLNDHYGMSSRYAVQFMLVPVGIILIIADIMDGNLGTGLHICNTHKTHFGHIFVTKLCRKYATPSPNFLVYIIAFSFIAFFITYGRTITTLDEINKIPARHFCYESAYNLAHNIENYPPSEENDEFLMSVFEYRRGADLIRDAFKTLKEHKLNIYKK